MSSCEPSGSSSESERITGSLRVPDANIRSYVIVEAGSQVSVSLGTFGGSNGPTEERFFKSSVGSQVSLW